MTATTLLQKFGADKINTATKYPSILTLHELGDRGRLTDEITTPAILRGDLQATEKIDGTNVRIICIGREIIIGSRENLLWHQGDLFGDPAQGIVQFFRSNPILDQIRANVAADEVTVIYGELFGGKVSSQSKQYGQDQLGYRVFDMWGMDLQEFQHLLVRPIEVISDWREHIRFDGGLAYGQPFIDYQSLRLFALAANIPTVPDVAFTLPNTPTHESVLAAMQVALPETKVCLSESGLGRPEGLILRNHDRTAIVKIRFEDYQRTLKK